MDAIEDARKAAEAEFGTVLRWCFDIPGEAGLEAAEETVRLATDDRLRPGGPGVVRARRARDRRAAAAVQAVLRPGDRRRACTPCRTPARRPGPETVWDALHRPARRAHRPRHQLRPGPEAARPPRRARHRAGGLPDLQHRHPRGPHPRRAPDQGVRAGRGRWSPSTPTTRRCSAPTSTTSTRSPPASSTSTSAGLADLAKNAVEASFLDAAGKARINDEIDTYTSAWLAP